MMPRPERDLKNCPVFSDDVNFCENRENIPELADGDSLLSGVVGNEDDILVISAWVTNDIERLGYFGLYFRNRARELAGLSLKSALGGENYVYVVGFLYRHAIELYMKSIIASDPSFKALDPVAQGKAIDGRDGHDLSKLWERVRPLLQDDFEISNLQRVENVLLELDELDKKSDGFRYPFKADPKTGERKPLLDALRPTVSFDNFVWLLDALCDWFVVAEDSQIRHLESLAEIIAAQDRNE